MSITWSRSRTAGRTTMTTSAPCAIDAMGGRPGQSRGRGGSPEKTELPTEKSAGQRPPTRRWPCVSRLASVAGNRSMQGLAGLSRPSAGRAWGDDDQAGHRCRRRFGRRSRPRSGRLPRGSWFRASIVGGNWSEPGMRSTEDFGRTAGDCARRPPADVPFRTYSTASGVESNARCRATRGRSRRGFIAHGSVLLRQGAKGHQPSTRSASHGKILAVGSIHGASKRSILGSPPWSECYFLQPKDCTESGFFGSVPTAAARGAMRNAGAVVAD